MSSASNAHKRPNSPGTAREVSIDGAASSHDQADSAKRTKVAHGRVGGKIAIITGAGGAIGRTIALALSREGAKVAVCDLDGDKAAETVSLIQQQHGEAVSHKVDVSDEKQVSGWISEVTALWGGVDILVNNAAAFVFGTVEEATSADWDRVLGVNVKGYALCAKHVIPTMKARGGGSIVNIASISSFIAQPKFTPYNTSKGAIVQLTRCIAMDYGPFKIRCNSVCPGTIDTPATSAHAKKLGVTKEELAKDIVQEHFIKRLGTTEEVAAAVMYFASDESAFTTAADLVVDGGYLAH